MLDTDVHRAWSQASRRVELEDSNSGASRCEGCACLLRRCSRVTTSVHVAGIAHGMGRSGANMERMQLALNPSFGNGTPVRPTGIEPFAGRMGHS